MISVEQFVLKLTELVKLGRQSLKHRGVETEDNVTVEQIFTKIKEIPIYDFGKLNPVADVAIIKGAQHQLTENITPQHKNVTAEINITIEGV